MFVLPEDPNCPECGADNWHRSPPTQPVPAAPPAPACSCGHRPVSPDRYTRLASCSPGGIRCRGGKRRMTRSSLSRSTSIRKDLTRCPWKSGCCLSAARRAAPTAPPGELGHPTKSRTSRYSLLGGDWLDHAELSDRQQRRSPDRGRPRLTPGPVDAAFAPRPARLRPASASFVGRRSSLPSLCGAGPCNHSPSKPQRSSVEPAQ